MTEQERYDALFNVWITIGIARGYLGIGTPRNRTMSPQQLDEALARAEDALSSLTMQTNKAEVESSATAAITTASPSLKEDATETKRLASSDSKRRLVSGITQMEKAKQYAIADQLMEQLWALEEDIPDGLHPGRIISWPVAEGQAVYVVESVPAERCSLLRIGDEYSFEDVHEDGTCDIHTVQQAIAKADRNRKLAREREARREQKSSSK